jgi:PHP family Zn ribbon phosphoesterase
MSKTCRICQHIYHEARMHCPTCGGFIIGNRCYDVDTLRELVVAKGAQRQNYARTVRIAVASCDPDA